MRAPRQQWHRRADHRGIKYFGSPIVVALARSAVQNAREQHGDGGRGLASRASVLVSLAGAVGLLSCTMQGAVPRSSAGDAMADRITVRCAPAAGAAIHEPERLCAEVLEAMSSARPDLDFVAGGDGVPAAEVRITRGNDRGLGLEVIWIDTSGGRTPGTPLETTFFDRAPDAGQRRTFYAAFLNANPIPF